MTVQMPFESVVTEIYQDAFVGSSIENGTTVIQLALVGFQGRGCPDGIQQDFCPCLLLEAIIFQRSAQRLE